MKILNYLAILLCVVQLVAIVYFLIRYQSDNLPFFVLLIVVPVVCLMALLSKK